MVLASPRWREAQAVTVIQRFYRRWRPSCQTSTKPLRNSNIANLRERMQSLRRRHDAEPVNPRTSFAKPGKGRTPQKPRTASKDFGQPRIPSPIGVKNTHRVSSSSTAAPANKSIPPKPPRPFPPNYVPVEGVRAAMALPAPAPAPNTFIPSPRSASPEQPARFVDDDDLTRRGSVDLKHQGRVHESMSTVATASSAAPTRSIMSFLDEVDEHLRTDLSIISQPPSQVGDSTVEAGSALKSRNSMLGLEVEDKRQIIAHLRSMLEDQKARTIAAERAAALIWEHKMQKMKEDGEKVCERQFKMCDRLMHDKAQLTSKCAQLAEEFNTLKRQYENRVVEMQQGATKELTRQRNNWAAMEKMRREQWEKDRTKEIKEMTIKGLEPEVEKILNERKHERRRLEEQYREKTDNLRTELQQLASTKVRETKELCLLEQDVAVEKERESMRHKLHEERARFDRAMSEERAKCANDLQQQERCAQQERLQCQQRATDQQKQSERDTEVQFEERIHALKQKLVQEEDNHERELRQGRAQLDVRKAELDATFERRVEDEKRKIEKELKEKFAQERDAQLEAVVEKLGRDAFEKERFLRQKVDDATEELKKEHSMTLRQQHELLRAREMEAMEATKEKEVAQLQKQFFEQEFHKMTQDKNTLETSLANAKAAHQAQLDEGEHLKTSMVASIHAKEQALAECEQRAVNMVNKANEALASERMQREREAEAAKEQDNIMREGVEDRIKRALAVKDEQIRQLKGQLSCAECKVDEFPHLLQQQREELLGKLT